VTSCRSQSGYYIAAQKQPGSSLQLNLCGAGDLTRPTVIYVTLLELCPLPHAPLLR